MRIRTLLNKFEYLKSFVYKNEFLEKKDAELKSIEDKIRKDKDKLIVELESNEALSIDLQEKLALYNDSNKKYDEKNVELENEKTLVCKKKQNNGLHNLEFMLGY